MKKIICITVCFLIVLSASVILAQGEGVRIISAHDVSKESEKWVEMTLQNFEDKGSALLRDNDFYAYFEGGRGSVGRVAFEGATRRVRLNASSTVNMLVYFGQSDSRIIGVSYDGKFFAISSDGDKDLKFCL